MTLRAFLIVIVTALVVSSCGGGGGGSFAGGIGGTGVSYGPVSGFGSVIVNGVEYDTSSADFSVEGLPVGSDTTGQSQLAVGMVVSVTHDDNGNAKSVSYKDDAEGPIDTKVDLDGINGSFNVLGIAVTVDSLTAYDGTTGITALADGDIVEVSGQITADNTVLATRVELKTGATCADGIEVKGTVTVVGVNTFTIGDIGSLLTVTLASHGLSTGDYVEVQSNTCPVGGILAATSVEAETEGPDTSDLDNPGEGELEIKGTASLQSGSGTDCTFLINGQTVLTTSATTLDGDPIAACENLDGAFVEAQGQIDVNGDLAADEINNEDGVDDADGEASGAINVLSNPSPLEGTINVDGGDTITVDLNTIFDGDSQSFNLDTMLVIPTCAEVKYNTGTMTAIRIEEESCI